MYGFEYLVHRDQVGSHIKQPAQFVPRKDRMARGNRTLVRFVSTAGTGYTYHTTKNKRTTPDRLEFMKYDPKIRKHVLFKESK